MLKKIEKLTKEQEARFPEFVAKWTKIGLSTEPANREKSEKAIRGLYELAKLKEPKIIWLPCPLSAAMSAVLYAYTRNGKAKTQRGAVNSAVRSAVGSAVGSAVRSAVNSAVRSAVNSAVRSAVRSAVDSAVNSAVRSAVRSAVDSAVDSAVNSAVRSAVDSAVRSAVDSAVNSAVDSAVYSAVDSAVRSAVNSAVRSAVGSAGRSFFGGSLWAGYSAWADYFNEVLGVSVDRKYLDLVENCGYYWLLDDVCFASERPTHINLDKNGRLHCETGQSIGYKSGWGFWHYHGIKIPAFIIEQPEKITSKLIDKEENTEVKRAMIARYPGGSAKWLRDSKAKLIDEQKDINSGFPLKLWRKDRQGDTPFVMVEMINKTKELDDKGHFVNKHYFIRVKPDIDDALEAVAWHHNQTKADYLLTSKGT